MHHEHDTLSQWHASFHESDHLPCLYLYPMACMQRDLMAHSERFSSALRALLTLNISAISAASKAVEPWLATLAEQLISCPMGRPSRICTTICDAAIEATRAATSERLATCLRFFPWPCTLTRGIAQSKEMRNEFPTGAHECLCRPSTGAVIRIQLLGNELRGRLGFCAKRTTVSKKRQTNAILSKILAVDLNVYFFYKFPLDMVHSCLQDWLPSNGCFFS